MVDLTSNEIVATCNTTCADSFDQSSSCTANIKRDLQSFDIRLFRKNDTLADSAFLANASVGSFGGGEEVYLNWYIKDQPSCKEAEKERKSYACLSPSSKCVSSSNVTAGYWCECPNIDVGNPFVPHGCPDDLLVNVLPSNNCTTKCGDVNISFPFGLESGCYRDESFLLICDETSNPPILSFDRTYTEQGGFTGQVNKIMVNEGQLELTSHVDDANGDFQYYQGGFFAIVEGRSTIKWAVFNNESCAVRSSRYACLSENSKCVDVDIANSSHAYRCECMDGFRGNPYIADGCQDINECETPEKYHCYGHCINNVGNYTCTDSKKLSGLLLGVIIGVSIGFVTLLVAISLIFATSKWKKISQKRTKERHFRENHGLLLQQLIASNDDTAEKIKIFSLEELAKATNNFDSSRILGQGGHGIVYKGILSDQRVVAIKQSKIKEKSEIDEFLNEIIILSQINHRNIVNLFGCCLEAEVPLLVYEFISNGTLFYHLHDPDRKSTLTWVDRLRIIVEVAGALEYLHSSASISIFHRDMKSSNILLDDYYTSKISDFGASRLIPLDQTHIFTAIQGTLGYLDPEYYQTCQLTKKSDVYSFGVILLELLTGEKPISIYQNNVERNLVMQFLQALQENQHFELMERRIVKEATREDLDKVAKLAETCLKLKGNDRPTMTEVEVQLRCLQMANSQTREKNNAKGDDETTPLLRNISYSPFVINPFGQTPNQCTRNYSLEREMINSMRHPR